jgi:carbonic anhydrase
MSTTDDLIQNAKAYEASFDKGELPLPPARKVAVLACMDARLNPYGLLGLSEGDAHVNRNAGGVVTDDEFKKSVQDDTGIKPEWAAEAFPDLDEDVKQSIARIEASPFIPNKDSVRGFVYDVHTGGLREVV